MVGPMVANARWPECRKFTLGDAMILIIAVGLGLALARVGLIMLIDALRSIPYARLRTWGDWWSYFFNKNHFAVSFTHFLNMVLLNFLVFLLPASLILRIKQPRPPLRSLIRQTGFVACVAPVTVFLVFLPLALVDLSGGARRLVGVAAQVLLATATPLAWLFLFVTRRWVPELGWIDRLGWILGVAWSACLTAHLVFTWLPLL